MEKTKKKNHKNNIGIHEWIFNDEFFYYLLFFVNFKWWCLSNKKLVDKKEQACALSRPTININFSFVNFTQHGPFFLGAFWLCLLLCSLFYYYYYLFWTLSLARKIEMELLVSS